MQDEPFDLAIIGGGINGCGIARDAAGRGLKVYLCEQDDLASGTSSASTKLIHGGLRYLEHYEFRLVREALIEREVLWKIAPHIIWPLRFVLPYHKGLRPAWLLRLGLFLYDHMGGRKLLPPTRTLDLRGDVAGRPLKPGYGKAFEYSDCWVEDSRLVVLNAMDAQARGAVIKTRRQLVEARREGALWSLTTRDRISGQTQSLQAHMLVNAAGPWVANVLGQTIHVASQARVRLVQGSHIVVRKLHDDPRCYFFQNPDGRIIFAIPYERDFTLIGTTDHDYHGDPAAVAITPAEITYLCNAASEYFGSPIVEADVVWTYSGVRPLYDDGASAAQEATRDYVLTLDEAEGTAPLLSIFGGKITTYRRLAEAALDRLEPYFSSPFRGKKGWTGRAALPGGAFAHDGYEANCAALTQKHPFLDKAHAMRLIRAYGLCAYEMLEGIETAADMGENFGADLYECEVRYLMAREFACTAQDMLWRRSKLGLRIHAADAARLTSYIEQAKISAQ